MLREVTRDEARSACEQTLGLACDSVPGLAELAREELAALGACTRRVLIQRLCARLAPLGAVDEARLAEVLRQLEAFGDVTRGPGGWIAAAPLRLVELGGLEFFVLGSASTRSLGVLLPGRPVPAPGAERLAPRRWQLQCVAKRATLVERVASLGGLLLSVARWTGLDREPPADADWLGALEDGLQREGTRPAALEDGTEHYVPPGDSASRRRWHREGPASPHLIRARQPGGWFRYGWLDPTADRLLPLPKQDARRTTFAVDRAAGRPLVLQAWPQRDEFALALSAPLPLPEYRLLLARGQLVAHGKRHLVQLPAGAWAEVKSILEERLGVSMHLEIGDPAAEVHGE